MVGVIGPIGSGLPQFGFPRRLAMKTAFPLIGDELNLLAYQQSFNYMILRIVSWIQQQRIQQTRHMLTQTEQSQPNRQGAPKLIGDPTSYSRFPLKVNENFGDRT
jgi:hypothetical protein